ncbi:MAG: prepilin-type N-terminal cleavage/methylation domain-containing protein [Polyangiaceae bacterium]
MPSRRAARGLTLVEVLIVVLLIALLTGGTVMGSGMLKASRVRAAATLLVSAVRLAQNRTNTNGRPVRLVLDLDRRRVQLEEAEGVSFARQKGDVAGGAAAADEAEKKARSETERIMEGPKPQRARFKPIKALSDLSSNTPGRELGNGVQIASVETDHDEEPVTEGRAYLYFWPGGITERAVVRLKRTDSSEDGLAVMISALTGRASIERGKGEFPPPREDPEGQGTGQSEEER